MSDVPSYVYDVLVSWIGVFGLLFVVLEIVAAAGHGPKVEYLRTHTIRLAFLPIALVLFIIANFLVYHHLRDAPERGALAQD
jgi:hypothetical protein